jgi:hypothetical protein
VAILKKYLCSRLSDGELNSLTGLSSALYLHSVLASSLLYIFSLLGRALCSRFIDDAFHGSIGYIIIRSHSLAPF